MDSFAIFCAAYLYIVTPLAVAIAFARHTSPVRRIMIAHAVIVLVASVVLAKGGGAIVNDPRPFVVMHTHPLVAHGPDNGFPSDHTLLVFGCAFGLLAYNRLLGIALCVVGALVGWGRVATLLHHPLDVFASVAFAVLANAIAVTMLRRRMRGIATLVAGEIGL